MNKTYRVIKSTYKEKDSFMVTGVDGGNRADVDCDSYVDADSLPELREMLDEMLAALDKPVMVEKRELVEI